MKLPGLDFDPDKYPKVKRGDKTFAEIPFSDWFPPDYENVWCFDINGKASVLYYSPARYTMVSPLSDDFEYQVKAYKYWLKELP